ncbi:hypothetical protein POV27_09595 [Aureisphaera galaxeae]|uniref:YEATS-associated helix-containing protein n=1 Tax=Aureisphaera galaxeae TaxID=1538023 RepID=UPI002350DBB9|nr:YEATS-associated helix-containing protein [Aureisphaera galaxeae]MDC8004304.1 hypothetical protein [Aureisphaera galaxeae]
MKSSNKSLLILVVLLCMGFQFNSLHAKEVDSLKQERKDTLCGKADERIKKVEFEDKVNLLEAEEEWIEMMNGQVSSFQKWIEDEEFEKQLLEYNSKIKERHTKTIKTIQDDKTSTILEAYKQTDDKIEDIEERDEELTKLKAPDYQLIIFIIILAGVIGGIARTNWPKLKIIKEEVEEVKETLTAVNSGITIANADALKTEMDDTIKKMNQAILDIEATIASNTEKSKTLGASILFGIIASSISILALTLTESKVLEFEKATDYFVLWAWCVLGAIFSKKWIEILYGRLENLVRK